MTIVFKIAIVSLFALLSLSGCRTNSIYNVSNNTINSVQISEKDVEQAIKLAGSKRGWLIKNSGLGLLVGTINYRNKHQATIHIPYSKNGYKINYKNSNNLKYDKDTNSIHKNYNKWVTYLEKDINNNLGIVNSGAKLADVIETNNDYKIADLNEKIIYMRPSLNYSKNSKVAMKIKSECNLTNQLSSFIVEYSKKHGFNIKVINKIKKSDIELIVEITESVSTGNLFTGHNKYTSISGKLVQNNNELSNFKAARHSRGGAFGAYKSSCSVLGRTIKTLASKDITSWLMNPVSGSRLGNVGLISQ